MSAPASSFSHWFLKDEIHQLNAYRDIMNYTIEDSSGNGLRVTHHVSKEAYDASMAHLFPIPLDPKEISKDYIKANVVAVTKNAAATATNPNTAASTTEEPTQTIYWVKREDNNTILLTGINRKRFNNYGFQYEARLLYSPKGIFAELPLGSSQLLPKHSEISYVITEVEARHAIKKTQVVDSLNITGNSLPVFNATLDINLPAEELAAYQKYYQEIMNHPRYVKKKNPKLRSHIAAEDSFTEDAPSTSASSASSTGPKSDFIILGIPSSEEGIYKFNLSLKIENQFHHFRLLYSTTGYHVEALKLETPRKGLEMTHTIVNPNPLPTIEAIVCDLKQRYEARKALNQKNSSEPLVFSNACVTNNVKTVNSTATAAAATTAANATAATATVNATTATNAAAAATATNATTATTAAISTTANASVSKTTDVVGNSAGNASAKASSDLRPTANKL